MGANGIELPDFMTPRVIERTYRRARELQMLGERHPNARALLTRGMNMARDRNGRMLLFLEKGAAYLRQENDAQRDRFEEKGYAQHAAQGAEFNEYAQWRLAYEKAVAPEQDGDLRYRTLGWIYAAVAEAIG